MHFELHQIRSLRNSSVKPTSTDSPDKSGEPSRLPDHGSQHLATDAMAPAGWLRG